MFTPRVSGFPLPKYRRAAETVSGKKDLRHHLVRPLLLNKTITKSSSVYGLLLSYNLKFLDSWDDLRKKVG